MYDSANIKHSRTAQPFGSLPAALKWLHVGTHCPVGGAAGARRIAASANAQGLRSQLAANSDAAHLLAESEELPESDLRLLAFIRSQCLCINAIIENILQQPSRERRKPGLLRLNHSISGYAEEARIVQPPVWR